MTIGFIRLLRVVDGVKSHIYQHKYSIPYDETYIKSSEFTELTDLQQEILDSSTLDNPDFPSLWTYNQVNLSATYPINTPYLIQVECNDKIVNRFIVHPYQEILYSSIRRTIYTELNYNSDFVGVYKYYVKKLDYTMDIDIINKTKLTLEQIQNKLDILLLESSQQQFT